MIYYIQCIYFSGSLYDLEYIFEIIKFMHYVIYNCLNMKPLLFIICTFLLFVVFKNEFLVSQKKKRMNF